MMWVGAKRIKEIGFYYVRTPMYMQYFIRVRAGGLKGMTL